MARNLKVYRTPIGFHDAYVAAPNQKAALKAWGADADLFARGVAEAVTDEALMREPLEKPGEVIRRPRGTSAEHMAALPKDPPKRPRRKSGEDAPPEPAPKPRRPPPRRRGPRDTPKPSRPKPRRPEPEPAAKAPPVPRRKAKPRPSRAKLDAAEAAIEEGEAAHRARIAEIRAAEKTLQEERRALERAHEAETAKREATLAKERERYGAALQAWRDD